MHLNNSFQFLNNITRIFIHFFTYMYFQKIQITLQEQYYQTGQTTLEYGKWKLEIEMLASLYVFIIVE